MPSAPAGRDCFSVGRQEGARDDIDRCCPAGTFLAWHKAILLLTGVTHVSKPAFRHWETRVLGVSCHSSLYNLTCFLYSKQVWNLLFLQSQAVNYDILIVCSLPCRGLLTEIKMNELYSFAEAVDSRTGPRGCNSFSDVHLHT